MGVAIFSKHILWSAATITTFYAGTIIENRSGIVSTLIQLYAFAKGQCAGCSGAITPAISAAADTCAAAAIFSTITACCRYSTAVDVDCATIAAAGGPMTKAAAADACATACIGRAIAAGRRNSAAVDVDRAAYAGDIITITISTGIADAADACATAILSTSTVAASRGKRARAAALRVDVERRICGGDARTCCERRTVTKNKVYCTVNCDTAADGKTTFRYDIPRTVSPTGSVGRKFCRIHVLIVTVPVNIAGAGCIRRQTHPRYKSQHKHKAEQDAQKSFLCFHKLLSPFIFTAVMATAEPR